MDSSTLKRTAVISVIKGRGAGSNRESRFDVRTRETDPEHLEALAHAEEDEAIEAGPRTQVTIESARSIISRNSSPDIFFDQSINPYKGCEHGCVYCYARPTHAYLGLSAGLDFETRLFAKANAAELLRKELSRPGYRPSLIALGANTDPYQPIERQLELSRQVLKVLGEFNHPVGITTKSALVTRDLDLLAPMAERNLVRVFMSIGTLDADVARKLEPRANTPARRLEAVRRLSQAGVPVGVIVAPVIPALTDTHLERVLGAAAEAGAHHAAYVLLRLPLEVRDLFVEWLETHFPLRAKHVMSLVQQTRDGKDYDASFGQRMQGSGHIADLIQQRFRVAAQRLGLNAARPPLDVSRFAVPAPQTAQRGLF